MQEPVRNRPLAETAAALGEAGLVLIDLDGCLAFDLEPHPAAAALIRRLGSRYAILSNNSTETPATLAAILARRGLAVDPGRVILAGTLMIDMLAAEAAGRPVCLLASAELRAYARGKGLVLRDDDAADFVVLARDIDLTYARLNHALGLLARGAELVIANPDLTHPGAGGRPVIETGALAAVFRAAVPGLRSRVIGKPEPLMFRSALERFGVPAARTLMIGDNPETDGRGAERAGIAPILVGEGTPYASIADLV